MFKTTTKQFRQAYHSLILARPLTRLYDRIRPLDSFGDRGERIAERYLLKQGYVIVDRSYQNAIGEIDLIAVDDRTVVFVEVKTRSSHEKGHPAEAVDAEKQKQLTRVGLSYMKWHHLSEVSVRFDVIAITWPSRSDEPQIEHFENAFEPVGDWNMFA